MSERAARAKKRDAARSAPTAAHPWRCEEDSKNKVPSLLAFVIARLPFIVRKGFLPFLHYTV